ncbi:MAG: heliorhodopsin HeR [Nocardioidaceae bacterium]
MSTSISAVEHRYSSLRRWNVALTVLHAAQVVAILVLGGGFAITVTSSFPNGPPGSPPPAPSAVFDVSITLAIAVFLGLAALDHLLTGTLLRATYERALARQVNPFRWIEYSFSATIMIVLIGFYNGITEVTAVIGVIGANVAMILFGWLQETANPPGGPTRTMLPFWCGCIAGVAPWAAVLVNTIGSSTGPGPGPPPFVYGIVVSLFLFFMSFAVNQWLQYRGLGRWSDYLYGEKVYLVLSLVAKSALAWQIFGGSLAG